MIRAGKLSGSWQVILADLALILFITVLAGFVAARGGSGGAQGDLQRATSQAIYRQTADATSLTQWLAKQGADPRARLTIIGRYSLDDQNTIAQEALAMWTEAGAAGYDARLIIEASHRSEISAQIAYDRSDMANGD